MVKRRICSNDMAEVPADAFLLDDGEGQMYFCNPRCLCLWAVALGTRFVLPEKQKTAVYILTSPEGSRRRFEGIEVLAQWTAAKALGSQAAEWLRNGEEISRD